MGEEKRVHDRKDLVLPLLVEAGEQQLTGESVNLSVGGVRAWLDADLPFGTRVKIHVVLPTMGEECVLEGEVRWSQKHPQGGFLVGLQFLRVRARILWALNELMRDS